MLVQSFSYSLYAPSFHVRPSGADHTWFRKVVVKEGDEGHEVWDKKAS